MARSAARHSATVRGSSTCGVRSSTAVATTRSGTAASRSRSHGIGLAVTMISSMRWSSDTTGRRRAEAARIGERPAGHVLVEDQPGAAAVAEHERRPDVRARRAAVHDVEEGFEARVVQRVRHPAGVGAAHAAAADDGRDAVPVVPAPAARRAAVAAAHERPQHLDVARQPIVVHVR